MSAHPSSFTLDLRALDALPAEVAALVEAHLGACERCRSLVERDEIDRRRFVAEILPRGVLRAPARRPWRWAFFGAPAFAAAAAIALYVGLRAPDVAIKGGPSVVAYARHGDRVSVVADGAGLHPGDQIRFAVVPGEDRFVMIASIDSAGQASIYFPFDGAASASIADRGRTELPGSVVLDETLGPERIFTLFSRTPLESSDVRAALHAIGRDGAEEIRRARTLPVGADAQSTLLIEKIP